jgi:class 3 adenylate cyclase/HAMP domain-containing protein
MSIRTKIILIFSFTSAVIVASSSGVSYYLINKALHQELKGRIGNIARLGVASLDHSAYKRLVKKINQNHNPGDTGKIENSADYLKIYKQLNQIRQIEPALIRYVYLLYPGKKPDEPRFVVDADVLTLVEEEKKSGETSEEISHFAQVFDISSEKMRFMKQALVEKKAVVEESLTYDEEYNIHAISAYAPIFDEDGKTFLGIIGLDMSDGNIRESIRISTLLSLLIIIISVLIAFFASFLSGSFITKGIIGLTRVTKEFAEKNFGVRAKILSADEVGQLGKSFNAMAQTIEDYSSYLEKLLKAYGNFVPHTFLKLLGKESIVEVELGDHIQKEMTILFSDIRSFTTLSESMSPDDNFRFINAYLGRVGPLIRNHNGIIDKYIGDAVMAFFPTQPDDALYSAIQMQRKVRDYNDERARAAYAPITIGVGIHTGNLSLGTVGEAERMNGTVISDAVNLASRLEEATKVYHAGVIISEDTLKKLENQDKFYIRFLDKIQVRGKYESVAIYEIYNGDIPEDISWKEDTREDLEKAIQL